MKKTTYLYLLTILTLLSVGIWFLRVHQTPLEPPHAPSVQTLPKPIIPKTKPTTITLKAIDTPVSHVALPRQILPVSEVIRRITGQEEETANRYVIRSNALGQLGDQLTSCEVQALLDYLASTEDVLRSERVAALKNDIWNVLRNQQTVSPKLVTTTIEMFDAQHYDTAILDYCIQHLGALQEQLKDATQLESIRLCIRRASLVPGASYAGTALIAMSNNPNISAEDRDFMHKRTIALVSNNEAHEAARITAIQLSAEEGYTEVLPMLRIIPGAKYESVSIQIVAIATLGKLGTDADIERLKTFSKTHNNPRLRPALERITANRK